MHVLAVIDMQNDFIDGALGTPEAQAIVPRVASRIRNFEGEIVFTRDTHGADYLDTQEGKNLPVPHCIEGTAGWQINDAVVEAFGQRQAQGKAQGQGNEQAHVSARSNVLPEIVDKSAFGSMELGMRIQQLAGGELESITLVGLCTDICVISNALILKACFPEVPIFVDSSCCAGVTPESHDTALAAMRACQIRVL